MIWVWACALAVTVFLMVLNGYMRGSLTHWADALLGAIWLGLLVAAFFLFGWKVGVGAIPGSLVLGAPTQPIAQRIAAWLAKRT